MAVLAWGCASGPAQSIRYQKGLRAAATADGLQRVQAYRTDALYVLPGADLSGYSHFVINPVQIFYRDPAPGEPKHEFHASERERFEQMVHRELETAFRENGELAPSAASGPGVLRVRAQFVDLSLGIDRRASPSTIEVWTTTEFRLFLDVSDSTSNKSLLRMVDFYRLHPSSLGFPLASGGVAHPSATNVTTMEESAAIRHTVGNRARALSESLNRVRRAGPTPAVSLRAS